MATLRQRGTYRYNELLHDGHRLLEKQFPAALWHGAPNRPEVALTFDDGPSERDLPQILATLAHSNAVATFFFIGEKVAAAAPLVRAVAAAGHTIGMHGYRHRAFPTTKPALLRAELQLTRVLISRICGWEPGRVRNVRPPYGAFMPITLDLLARWGYQPIMWSLVPFHWQFEAALTYDQLHRRVTNGSLIVLHEDVHAGPPVTDVLSTLLPILTTAGLRTVSVDAMWAGVRA